MKTILLPVLLLSLALPAAAGRLEGNLFGPNGLGQPLQGVDIDVFKQATGFKLKTPNDDTGVGGSFSIVLPDGLYRVGFDPIGFPGLAPKQLFNVQVKGLTDIDNVFLEQGAVVSGKVLGPGGVPVAGADLDLVDTLSGLKAFTSQDNTDAAGNFAFAVALSQYMVQVEPLVTSGLAAIEQGPFLVTGNTNLGTFNVGAGVRLSGTVLGPGGGPVAGVDTDATETGSGLTVPLADDPSDAKGIYAVVVPMTTLDVVFAADPGVPFQAEPVSALVIAGDTLQDVSLRLNAFDLLPTAVGLRQQFRGSLAAAPEVDEATFDGLAGTLMMLSLSSSVATAKGGVALRAPSGALMDLTGFRKERKKGVRVRAVPLTETGTHTLAVYSRTGEATAYKLRVAGKVPKSLRKTKLLDTVATPGQVLDVAFGAYAGSTVNITLKPKTPGFLPEIVELKDPAGGSLSLTDYLSVTPKGLVRVKKAPLPDLGSYTLRVGGQGAATGGFQLLILVRPPRFPKGPVDET